MGFIVYLLFVTDSQTLHLRIVRVTAVSLRATGKLLPQHEESISLWKTIVTKMVTEAAQSLVAVAGAGQ